MNAAPVPQYVWRARFTRVIDGDTIELEMDHGFGEVKTDRCRLWGINCPEVHGATKAAGVAATEFTRSVIDEWVSVPAKWPLVAATYKTDSFGRYLVDVYAAGDPVSLSQRLLDAGHAVVFFP